jgi:hypothetical protein
MEVKTLANDRRRWYFACKAHGTAVWTTMHGSKGRAAVWRAMEKHAAKHHPGRRA